MQRQQMLSALDSTPQWDVIVIGGGATGLGAAVDAASRGLRTVLVEARDFAHGTSSRSTKLIHGGIRYLRQGQWSMVREALRERELLRQNAPHLVHAQPFIIPTFRAGARWYYLAGVKLYDALARSQAFSGSRLLSPQQVHERMPGLTQERLHGGIAYFDGQFDDARLAINLARTFADLGGAIVNYMPVRGLVKSQGRIKGVAVQDSQNGGEREIRGRAIINATGVFSDALRRMDEPACTPGIVASQGIHLVLDRSWLGSTEALMIPETDDGRVLFAIPWHSRLLVGTTDAAVETIDTEPRPMAQEVEFVLEHIGRYLTRQPAASDVLSAFAGLRPLVKPTGDSCATGTISRDCSVSVAPSGLVTICGGKWTTYRHMGQIAVETACTTAGIACRPSTTQRLPIHGSAQIAAPARVNGNYGSDAPLVEAMANGDSSLLQPLHANLPCRPVDVIWAVRQEMAQRVEDVLSRRTRCLLLDARASIAIAPQVAQIMARELDRDHAWQMQEIEAFTNLASRYIVA